MKHPALKFFASILVAIILAALPALAWEHHSLITKPLLSSMPLVSSQPSVEVVVLEDFLTAMEPVLETVLAEEEQWARNTMEAYAPLPDALAFRATGDPSDIRKRFFEAIRINPDSRAALYLSELVEDPEAPRTGLDPAAVTLVPGSSELKQFRFLPIAPGDKVSPLEVLCTASHEPDYGLDIGLFVDNGTDFGARYGFGEQPFGDPDLVYGSQAPFHMGFYHESPLVFLFAAYLKATYPEFRIHLYKTLAETAFDHGQDYWGWRFMGWGLHHVMDLSMPYHSTVLPGYSTFKMLFINLLSILGYPQYVDDALQLVSNRHMALERFQGIQFVRLTRSGDAAHPLMRALQQADAVAAYNDAVPREEVARQSNALAGEMNAILTEYMPHRFVNDPSVELGEESDLDQVVELVASDYGPEAVESLNVAIGKTMTLLNTYARGYITSILVN
jgi:hypothetical protein